MRLAICSVALLALTVSCSTDKSSDSMTGPTSTGPFLNVQLPVTYRLKNTSGADTDMQITLKTLTMEHGPTAPGTADRYMFRYSADIVLDAGAIPANTPNIPALMSADFSQDGTTQGDHLGGGIVLAGQTAPITSGDSFIVLVQQPNYIKFKGQHFAINTNPVQMVEGTAVMQLFYK